MNNQCLAICIAVTTTVLLHANINLSLPQPSNRLFSDAIPLEQRITLELLQEKILKHHHELRYHWDSVNAQFIVQAAELELNLAPSKIRFIIMQRIIAMFQNVGINITIWPDNSITRLLHHVHDQKDVDDTIDHHAIQNQQQPQQHTQAPHAWFKKTKRHEPSQSVQPTIKKPERIHGAGRTLKKIKKRLEQYQKQREERIKKYRLEEQELRAKQAAMSHQDVVDLDHDHKHTIIPEYQEIEL